MPRKNPANLIQAQWLDAVPASPAANGERSPGVVIGSSQSDFVEALANEHHFFGRDGDDLVWGYNEDWSSRLWLFGQAGDDILIGGLGNDILNGGSGNDQLYGATGNDRLFGMNGDDSIAGGSGNSLLNGGSGDDQLYAQGGGNRVFGMQGDDWIIDGEGNDTLRGGAGNDIISVTGGDNLIDGGAGFDMVGTLDFRNSGSGVYLPFDGRTMTVETDAGVQTLKSIETVSFVYGSDYGDYITPQGTTSWAGGVVGIYSYGGDDYVVGTGVYGGEGNDTIIGLSNYYNDLVGENGDDVIIASGDVLQAFLEGGDGNDLLIGNGSGLMLITGDGGDDTLVGGNGRNRMGGGAGNDSLYGGTDVDVFIFHMPLAIAGIDTIFDFGPDDLIGLNPDAFPGLDPGYLLDPQVFVHGTAALDPDDRIIYDSITGTLYFDIDGTGMTAQVAFAVLSGNPTLQASDIGVFGV